MPVQHRIVMTNRPKADAGKGEGQQPLRRGNARNRSGDGDGINIGQTGRKQPDKEAGKRQRQACPQRVALPVGHRPQDRRDLRRFAVLLPHATLPPTRPVRQISQTGFRRA